MKEKIITIAFFLGAAICLVWVARAGGISTLQFAACGVGLFGAACAAPVTPRLAGLFAVLSGTLALFVFARSELRDFPALNSWILLNMPGNMPGIATATSRVMFVATTVVAVGWGTTCLTHSLSLRNKPLHQRAWPPLALSAIVLIAWFLVSVRPYRLPIFVRAVPPELVILHVKKDGLQFHETSFTVYHDGKVYVERNDRRLLRYAFHVDTSISVLLEEELKRVRALAESPELSARHTPAPVALLSWKAEGWFVLTRYNVLAFTSANRNQPPQEVVDFFHELERSVPSESSSSVFHDVCLGFCYDPTAGLGLRALNERCRSGSTFCE